MNKNNSRSEGPQGPCSESFFIWKNNKINKKLPRSDFKELPQANRAVAVTGPRKRREKNGKKYMKIEEFP